MKLKVLGSASISSIFKSPAYVIDNQILIDVPNGCVKDLLKTGYDICSLNNVLITHFHADHFFDIPFVFLIRNGKTDEILNFYCGHSGLKKIPALINLGYPDLYNMLSTNVKHRINDSSEFSVNNYSVARVPVVHGTMDETYGYIFTEGTNKIGFTGDTSFCESVKQMASQCKNLICECSVLKGTERHMGVDNICQLSSSFPNCTFYTTHMTDEARNQLKKENLNNVRVLEDFEELLF